MARILSAAGLPDGGGQDVQTSPQTGGAPQPTPAWSVLREELILEPAAASPGGAPTWTLYDPSTHRFYRLGWTQFEILSRWHLRSSNEIAKQIGHDTTLHVSTSDIDEFAQFLSRSGLLQCSSAQQTRELLSRKQAGRQTWYMWLLHHYLFIRIPLIKPDRALTRLLPCLSWIYSRAFLAMTALTAIIGLYLALRQWDTFKSTFPWFFSLEGAAVAAVALLISKMLHELGHGLTAKRFGCRVPTMGVALLVMAPVLYTDTSGAWRLRKTYQRLAIGCAGMAAECCLAAYALLLWSLFPDGIIRSVLFVWATTTWLLTVFINMSPFMRFDGYYLLSDLVSVPNLQDRSFALARHQIREWLFDLNEKPPEPWGPGMRRLLLAYAFATWTYRLVLFVGIAFVVYHTFFKALGILLFAIEVWWFIARPIVRELGEWNRRWRGRRLNGRTAVTATLAALLLGALLVPWRTTIYAPAVLTAEVRAQLFSQVAGQVAAIHVRSGAQVRAGDVLVELVSPEIAYRLQQARRKVEGLAAQISALSQISETQSRAQQVRQELEGARAELSAAETEQTRLAIKSPTDGIVVDLADPMGIGEWVKASEPIATVIEPTKWRVNAYVSEEDFGRIKVGAPASFIPADVAGPRQTATVLTIDYAATRILSDSELSSNYGGPIAARSTANDLQVPELPVYRVTLAPEAHARPAQTSLGTAIITGESRSVAIQLWRRVASVLIRESGF